jgi:hypothetical protein
MIGVSNVSVEELQRARGIGEIVSVQNRYHLGDRASEDVLAVCERARIAFLPWFPIGAGALARADELQVVFGLKLTAQDGFGGLAGVVVLLGLVVGLLFARPQLTLATP